MHGPKADPKQAGLPLSMEMKRNGGVDRYVHHTAACVILIEGQKSTTEPAQAYKQQRKEKQSERWRERERE